MAQEEFQNRIEEVILTLRKDFDTLDINGIKENILTYSDINYSHGLLPKRPLKNIKTTTDNGETLNPFDAEKEDTKRYAEAQQGREETESFPNPIFLENIVSLGKTSVGFFPFDLEQNIKNCWLVTTAISGHAASAHSLKNSYFNVLNKIQNSNIPNSSENIVVAFNNFELINNLIREGVLEPHNVPQQLFDPFQCEFITGRIMDAIDYIKAVDIKLHDLIVQFIGTIVCIKRQGSSGTVSSLIGMIWLNPNPTWNIVDYAENIVHEFIHNTIFLADLSQTIFAMPHWYAPKESLVVSAMKQYPRGINIVFHSLFVSVGLIIFLEKSNQTERALNLTAGIEKTTDGLNEKKNGFLTDFGQELLTAVTFKN
jgi:hypothetical protein